jgi:hypothetical protein
MLLYSVNMFTLSFRFNMSNLFYRQSHHSASVGDEFDFRLNKLIEKKPQKTPEIFRISGLPKGNRQILLRSMRRDLPVFTVICKSLSRRFCITSKEQNSFL